MVESSPETETIHVPVLVREVIRGLDLFPGAIVVDGTVGAGGHSQKILASIGPQGRLIGLDRDPAMLRRAARRVSGESVTLVQRSYSQLDDVLRELQIHAVDRILVDLGLSSDQLNDRERGFSFLSPGALDLRFDPSAGVPTWEWLAQVDEATLRTTLETFGEEPQAARLAQAILARRKQSPLRTAAELTQVIEATLGGQAQRDRHIATRTFQALRIASNHELELLQTALDDTFPRCLKPGGLLAAISFHSLEDRLLKEAFKRADTWESLTAKPITPTPAEERVNPRSRSAKLRIARRVGDRK